MKKILVTNDDGVHSDGIHALARGAAPPRRGDRRRAERRSQRHRPRADAAASAAHRAASAEGVYEVDGTPTDCVNIAITQLLDAPPDFVVSGINKGYNLGDDVTYSGTVAGALEGALLGIPSIAVSLERTRGAYDFGPRRPAPRPRSPRRMLAAARCRRARSSTSTCRRGKPQGHPRHRAGEAQSHHRRRQARPIRAGRPYYWIEEGENDWEPHDRSDYQAVRDGYVSVTPLQPDLTALRIALALLGSSCRTWRPQVEVE